MLKINFIQKIKLSMDLPPPPPPPTALKPRKSRKMLMAIALILIVIILIPSVLAFSGLINLNTNQPTSHSYSRSKFDKLTGTHT